MSYKLRLSTVEGIRRWILQISCIKNRESRLRLFISRQNLGLGVAESSVEGFYSTGVVDAFSLAIMGLVLARGFLDSVFLLRESFHIDHDGIGGDRNATRCHWSSARDTKTPQLVTKPQWFLLIELVKFAMQIL